MKGSKWNQGQPQGALLVLQRGDGAVGRPRRDLRQRRPLGGGRQGPQRAAADAGGRDI